MATGHLSWALVSPPIPGAPCPSTPALLAGVHCPCLYRPYANGPEQEPLLSGSTDSFSPCPLETPLPHPEPRLNNHCTAWDQQLHSLGSGLRTTPPSPVPSSLPFPATRPMSLFHCPHPAVDDQWLRVWEPRGAVSRGVAEPPVSRLGQECAHHEACLSRETWPASCFSSGTAC